MSEDKTPEELTKKFKELVTKHKILREQVKIIAQELNKMYRESK